ncbi:hypothetical protein V8B97DRAFT_2021194 [Scleroderma yunnanense]
MDLWSGVYKIHKKGGSTGQSTWECAVSARVVPRRVPESPLVFASGGADEAQGRGVKLGAQQGGICVDDEQVRVLHIPVFTSRSLATVLDTYSVQGYISPKVVSWDNVLVRYLSLGDVIDQIGLFSPPNLVQSTTASLLLILRSLLLKLTRSYEAALFLLSSPKLPLALPTTIVPSPSDDIHWDQRIMQKAQSTNVDSCVETGDRSVKLSAALQCHRAGGMGEGGMYI